MSARPSTLLTDENGHGLCMKTFLLVWGPVGSLELASLELASLEFASLELGSFELANQ